MFAVPGEAGSSRSRGAHQLIRQGAKLVETVNDIIEEIAPQLTQRDGARETLERRELPAQTQTMKREKCSGYCRSGALHIDEVIEASGLCRRRKFLEILLNLELQVSCNSFPGQRYAVER